MTTIEGLLGSDRVERFARRIARVACAAEFSSFWVGTAVEGHRKVDDTPEQQAARRRFNEAVGLRVLELVPGLDATPESPEAHFVMRVPSGGLAVELRPLLVCGRYLKFSRSLPQSKWPCTRHTGPDCPRCGGTGKIYPTSVEEMIAEEVLKETGGKGTRMIALGREDVDARMLGRGRPFILSIGRALRRTVDLADAERRVNRRGRGEIEVRGLRAATRQELAAMLAARPDKAYRAECEAERALSAEALARLNSIRGLRVRQRTPARVRHRRADIERTRAVRSVRARLADRPDRLVLDIVAESGTYIKEFVSGDAGNTHPSVSEIAGVSCRVALLDVTDVDWPPDRGKAVR